MEFAHSDSIDSKNKAMPNPYPGMNPYLEDPFHWQGFHNGLIAVIGKSLNAMLPAGYRAVIEQTTTVLPYVQARKGALQVVRRPARTLDQSGAAVKERATPD